MSWYKRVKEGITTLTSEKKSVPDGLWHKCSRCKKTLLATDHQANSYVCPNCNYHDKIGSHEYFDLLFVDKYEELFAGIMPSDPLQFKDTKEYAKRLKESQSKSGMTDAMRVAVGNLSADMKLVVACMDFGFIGGSMGSVVGEKIARPLIMPVKIKSPYLLFQNLVAHV